VHVLVANGDLPAEGHDHCRRLLAQATRVLAVDGGLTHCGALGVWPDLVVGDLDSAPAELVTEAERRSIEIVKHPTDKDATDLQLAIERAVADGAGEIAVVAAFGGRLDHELATIAHLCSTDLGSVAVSASDGRWSLGPGQLLA